MLKKTSGFLRRAVQAMIGVGVMTAALGVSHAQASADKYPDRPIRMIVTFPPGGSVDAIARAVGQKMQENWGQPVLIENRPGASTLIGSTALAKSPPDGYTLIISVSNHTTNPAMRTTMPYDTLKDFQPISMLALAPIVVVANPKFAANNVKDLIALSKAGNVKLDFGSAGTGSMTHLTAEMLKRQENLNMTHILYKGGTPALMDVIAGHIPMTFATLGQVLPQLQAGQVKALGISSATRYPSMPDIPTFKEQGIDLVTTEWFGLMAPAGTPMPIVAKLNAEMKKIMASPGLGDRLTAIQLVTSTPEELDAHIRSELTRWAPVIKDLGIKAD